MLQDVFATVRLVLSDRHRRGDLVRLGPRGLLRLARFLCVVVPCASRALGAIRTRAARIPDPALREQALASIADKAYHVQGGAILATFLHGTIMRNYVAVIAPLETIYDYLDNLCDRLPGVDERAFAALHEALTDALDPDAVPGSYYRHGPPGDDGGYLRSLVFEVREAIARLPGSARVRQQTLRIARLYAQLQTFKHLAPSEREERCRIWYDTSSERIPGLAWWEFAAACGSSLPVFALLFSATNGGVGNDEIAAVLGAYFPYLSAVHILLDYFIDQQEDREHEELNFVACYAGPAHTVARLRELVRETAARLRRLRHGDRHEFLLRVMCLFYLTHPKVFAQRLEDQGTSVLQALA